MISMNDEESKVHAKVLLEAAGYSVTSILQSEVQGQKRADLKATLNQEILIVEAKGKAPHQGYFDLREMARTQGHGSCAREVAAWNALSSIAEKANRQLEETPAPETSVRILWISCLHEDWEFVFDAFQHRLYGDVEVSLFPKAEPLPQTIETRRCFYYEAADFCRYRSIDAAVLAGPNGAKVLVNEFGFRVQQLRTTKLYTGMMAKNALSDPETLRQSGKALAILGPIPNDQKAKWKYLLETYELKTSVLHSYHWEALITLQLNQSL